MSKPNIPRCVIVDQSDYTFYYPRLKQGDTSPEKSTAGRSPGQEAESAEQGITKDAIIDAAKRCVGQSDPYTNSFNCSLGGADSGEHIEDARLLAASCFQGRLWSITVRSKKDNRTATRKPQQRPWNIDSKYSPSPEYEEDKALFSVKDVCEILKGLLFPESEQSPQGAIIVMGATASAKSQITRGLIHGYMADSVAEYQNGRRKRKPHLVTVEDPIEEWFLPTTSGEAPPTAAGSSHGVADCFEPIRLESLAGGGSFDHWPVDYTPRELKVDVEDVPKALLDALRQTPSAVFVSEIRDDGWKSFMDFAGTGHLVFATGHAGSLAEAMRKILKALDAKTPADRAEVAERILGLIHVRREVMSYEESGSPMECPALTVTLWRRMGAGKQGFISDGLAALAPQAGALQDMSAFGRHWFSIRMLERESGRGDVRARRERCRAQLLRKTRELDLEGL